MREVRVALVVIALATTPTFSHGKVFADDALSREEAETVLCQPRFHWDCAWVVNKAWRESRFKPEAINWDCDGDGSYRHRCYGFLQLEEGWAPNGDVAALLDLWTNIQIAHDRIYMASGTRDWGG
jgi:hypothetical protein